MSNQAYFLILVLTSVVGFLHHDVLETNSGKDNGRASALKSKVIIDEVTETVRLDWYYEVHCPFCIEEYHSLVSVVQKLGASLDLQTYPYGNAHIFNESGKISVRCQHGEDECYGNKLHACAIDYLQHNESAYVPYNDCMMIKLSNDSAADECGKSLNIASEPIKSCAKEEKGQDLLLHYGEESEKVHFDGVPWDVIKGKYRDPKRPLMEALCEAFKHPPEACKSISLEENGREAFEPQVTETVRLQVLYECLCPGCMEEYPHVVNLMEKLGASVDLETYPYGNAEMHNDSGKVVVECQHGEKECYGNKLHACAIDYLQHNVPAYVPFNGCMMSKHSDDSAADECGKLLNVDSEPIKTCAKGQKGQDLLVWYGTESQKISYNYVPYIIINGKTLPEQNDLMKSVCEAFKQPPKACNEISESKYKRKLCNS